MAQDDTMCYGSEEEHSSGDEFLVGDQDADYSQLDRVIGGGSGASQTVGAEERRRIGGRLTAQRGGASQLQSFDTQHGRRRQVHGVQLFTTPPGQRVRRAVAPTVPPVNAVPNCMSVEDITAVGSQALASAFNPVVQASPIHIAPSTVESQPSIRRPRIPRRTGKWTNSQLRDAMATVDRGMSLKKASDLYHIPYSSFREWYHGLGPVERRGHLQS